MATRILIFYRDYNNSPNSQIKIKETQPVSLLERESATYPHGTKPTLAGNIKVGDKICVCDLLHRVFVVDKIELGG